MRGLADAQQTKIVSQYDAFRSKRNLLEYCALHAKRWTPYWTAPKSPAPSLAPFDGSTGSSGKRRPAAARRKAPRPLPIRGRFYGATPSSYAKELVSARGAPFHLNLCKRRPASSPLRSKPSPASGPRTNAPARSEKIPPLQSIMISKDDKERRRRNRPDSPRKIAMRHRQGRGNAGKRHRR